MGAPSGVPGECSLLDGVASIHGLIADGWDRIMLIRGRIGCPMSLALGDMGSHDMGAIHDANLS